MLIRDSDYVDDGDSWQKLNQEVKAETANETMRQDLLTMEVMVAFLISCARKLKEEEEKKLKKKMQKQGFKNCPATYGGGKGACSISKEEKMTLRNKGVKRCIKTSGEDEEGEDYMFSKKKKQKRNSRNEKKKLKKTKTKTQGFKTCPATYGGEKEACLIRKEQKMIIGNKGVKRCAGTSAEDENDEDYMFSKQKKQRQTKINHKQKTSAALLILDPPADMPEAFKNCIDNLGGTQIKLVLQKIIYDTDLSKSHNRLLMSMKKLRNKFLSEEEAEEVSRDKGGMDVILVQPCLEVSKVHLTKWLVGGSQAYVLNTQWYHQVVINNPDTLKRNAVIQIWSFRVVDPGHSQLGFALIPVGDAKDGCQIN